MKVRRASVLKFVVSFQVLSTPAPRPPLMPHTRGLWLPNIQPQRHLTTIRRLGEISGKGGGPTNSTTT